MIINSVCGLFSSFMNDVIKMEELKGRGRRKDRQSEVTVLYIRYLICRTILMLISFS